MPWVYRTAVNQCQLIVAMSICGLNATRSSPLWREVPQICFYVKPPDIFFKPYAVQTKPKNLHMDPGQQAPRVNLGFTDLK